MSTWRLSSVAFEGVQQRIVEHILPVQKCTTEHNADTALSQAVEEPVEAFNVRDDCIPQRLVVSDN